MPSCFTVPSTVTQPYTQVVTRSTAVQVAPAKQSKPNAQFSATLTANGGVDMDRKKLKFSFNKFSVGVAIAASLSGAP